MISGQNSRGEKIQKRRERGRRWARAHHRLRRWRRRTRNRGRRRGRRHRRRWRRGGRIRRRLVFCIFISSDISTRFSLFLIVSICFRRRARRRRHGRRRGRRRRVIRFRNQFGIIKDSFSQCFCDIREEKWWFTRAPFSKIPLCSSNANFWYLTSLYWQTCFMSCNFSFRRLSLRISLILL